MAPYLWLAKPSWYDSAAQQANFVVLDSTRSYLYWEPRAVIAKYFGHPGARVPRRPLHRHGVGQEPAVQHSALTPRLPEKEKSWSL